MGMCWRPIFNLSGIARGVRSDRLSLTFSGKYRSSPILSLNPLFHEKHDSKSGKTTQAYIMKVPWPIEGISIASTKIYQYFYVFILFALVLSSNLQFCSLFIPTVASDILGGLADLEQPLGEILPMGSLPEERSKVIGVSSRTIQDQTVRPPPGMIWPPISVCQRSCPVLGTRGRVRVMVAKLSASTHFLVTPLGRISG
jgi:hypothetical protein